MVLAVSSITIWLKGIKGKRRKHKEKTCQFSNNQPILLKLFYDHFTLDAHEILFDKTSQSIVSVFFLCLDEACYNYKGEQREYGILEKQGRNAPYIIVNLNGM